MSDSAPRERNWVAPLVTLIGLVVLWDLVVRVFDVKPFILPTPWMVGEALVRDFGSLVHHGTTTMQEVLAGFALSVIVGVPLALAIASSPLFERSAYPLLVGSQAVPKIAIAPLFVIWFGFGIAPKILMAFLISFFPVVVAGVVGLRSVEAEKLYLARSMGATRWQTFAMFRLPSALPSLFGGLKLAITFAVTGAIVGEFIGADRGLGYVLIFANGGMDTTLMFAALVWISVLALAFYALVAWTEKACLQWHVSHRSTSRHAT